MLAKATSSIVNMCMESSIIAKPAPIKRRRAASSTAKSQHAKSKRPRKTQSAQEPFADGLIEKPGLQEALQWMEVNEEVSHSHLTRLELCRSVSEELKVFFQRDSATAATSEDDVTLSSILAQCLSPRPAGETAVEATSSSLKAPCTVMSPPNQGRKTKAVQQIPTSRDASGWTTGLAVRTFDVPLTASDRSVSEIDVAQFCFDIKDKTSITPPSESPLAVKAEPQNTEVEPPTATPEAAVDQEAVVAQPCPPTPTRGTLNNTRQWCTDLSCLGCDGVACPAKKLKG